VLKFPGNMRPSTIDEREKFYRSEFDVAGLKKWIGQRQGSLKFAMILGRHTGIVSAYHKNDKDNVILIDDWKSGGDIREYALEYLPESLYYDRNRYHDLSACSKCGDYPESCPKCHKFSGQQLAFDLDPENVDCPYHGHIGKKMQLGRGLSFCMYEFRVVRRKAFELAEELKGTYEDVGVVYSGRGFHVVVNDEKAYTMPRKERKALARRTERNYPIDEWVTAGDSRLMRLPLSLNALVSRKCMIMKELREFLKFDPRVSNIVIPAFLKSARS